MFKKLVFEYKLLLRSIPSAVVAFYVLSVILMNLLANKEFYVPVSWLSLDCGFLMSWVSFLTMDIVVKRFGARASIELSIFATAANLFTCLLFAVVARISGNWGEYYNLGAPVVNQALNNTIGGSWFVLLGSTIAFLVSAVVNSITNSVIGRRLNSGSFKHFALRSYISTFIGQFVDNLIFALIVSHNFFGWSLLQCITCAITGGVFELLCEIIFSPAGYKISQNWVADNVGEEYISRMEGSK